jgi:branched-chain amino acid transport system substrate-binding protein
MPRTRRRFLTIGCSVLAVGATLASLALAQGKPPVKIAIIVPLSGPGAFDGQVHVDAARTVAKLINAKGGILGGREVTILPYDDKGLPEEGVTAAKRAIAEDHVDAIASSLNSTVALAMKEVTKDKILHVVMSAQHPKITKERHKWLFRINETNDVRADRFARFICERLAVKTLSLLTLNDDYGRAEVAAYTPRWEKCGVKVIGNEFIERTDTDFTIPITKVKGQKADGVYVITSLSAQGATIYRQLKQLGYPGKVIAAGGNMGPKLVELSGASLEGVYSVVMFINTLQTPKAKEFITAYEREYKRPASHLEGLAAEAVQIITMAMDKAGTSTDYDKIAKTMQDGTWETVRGPAVKFDDIGQATAPNFIVQVKGGQITKVDY